jgi:hypothetical protein
MMCVRCCSPVSLSSVPARRAQEVEEKDRIGMSLNVGIHGMYPPEAMMKAHQALDSKLQEAVSRQMAGGLAQLLGLMK